jgi:hypothetical protein
MGAPDFGGDDAQQKSTCTAPETNLPRRHEASVELVEDATKLLD